TFFRISIYTSKKIIFMKRSFSNVFLLMGIFCFIFCSYLLFERLVPRNLSFNGKLDSPAISAYSNKKPVEIIIPSLSIDLPIIPSKITNNTWETTMKGVSYLTSSPIPGNKGNSILYGHNFWNLLGKLPQSKPGQEIDIVYSDRSEKKFVIQYTSVVSPNQIDILKPTQDNRITIYTCTGFLDT